jgi:hypothetical protein
MVYGMQIKDGVKSANCKNLASGLMSKGLVNINDVDLSPSKGTGSGSSFSNLELENGHQMINGSNMPQRYITAQSLILFCHSHYACMHELPISVNATRNSYRKSITFIIWPIAEYCNKHWGPF